ncbi:InlB B-repeat-containing protein [Listeria monocytogenes]|uniref:LPXTG cell wall anchor domain-containing protein n=1 Tax=Listeria monocytogenes TaxID=1639 RepID=A0A7U7YIM2_LISMN|nr:InlB B-repeat-containing protein [Listeria monocytogenes]MDA20750.1 LPXTG cell wall anchor domain-containing protein [Listeria monocytogenes serotype 4a]EAC4592411.1 LPXTG cell wall anchor domain-containing protein [Listeria monocytogenes]EAC4810880.1 LPXTG cell wall anchor domain-containing protein [Listeria monocytogenes]EAC7281779.1 LPXTG cell wall anchor domain-containing protein [Listeria monocytogenes]EAC7287755.1 LPXTG cell wall anchor domain-containing protein [Listeria monocytogene
MKRNKTALRILVTLAVVMAISFWVGTSSKEEVQAAVIAQPTPINEIFTDENLANAIKATLNKPSTTSDVSQAELDSISEVTAESSNIASLEGAQYLNNIDTLVLNNNKITTLNPLAGLSRLSILEVSNNQLSDISALSNVTNLHQLRLEGNQIKQLNGVSNLINLETIELSNNQITDISPISGLKNLIGLGIDNNKISDLSPISGLSKLNHLTADNNQISDLSPISSLGAMEIMRLDGNQISDVTPIANLANLSYVFLAENQISDISSLQPLFNSPNFFGITLDNQKITSEPVLYKQELVVPNNIKDEMGALISPDTISDNGVYASPNISWNLANYTNQVSYTFNKQLAQGSFSGTVTQPLHNAYTATFDVDGVKTNEVVEETKLLQEPTAPTKEGYTFTGWYDAKTGGNKWDFATDKMPAEDITLYAQFTINSYTATFDIDGKLTTQKVTYQSLLEEPAAPTKDGYTFKGWYDAKTGGTKWDFATGEMPAANITLYAQFTKNATPDSNDPTTVTPTGNGNGTSTPSNSGGNTTLPTAGDENTMLPIFVGVFLLGTATLILRKIIKVK